MLSERDRLRISEIEQEIARGSFEKAMELTVGCIEETKNKDPFAEARYNELASSVILHKFEQTPKPTVLSNLKELALPMIEYNLARKHLERSVVLYQSLGKTPRNQLLIAFAKSRLASFASLAQRPDDGLDLSLESFRICTKYKHKEGMKNALKIRYNLLAKKLTLEMANTMLDNTIDFETKCKRLDLVRDKLKMLKQEMDPDSDERTH